jgi:hypothetical protein
MDEDDLLISDDGLDTSPDDENRDAPDDNLDDLEGEGDETNDGEDAPRASDESKSEPEAEKTEETPGKPETEFEGFLIAAHGMDLHEPACEDEDSPEAQEYIRNHGERAYDKLVREYDRAKSRYQQKLEESLIQTARTGQETLTKEIQTEQSAIKSEWFPERAEDDLNALHKAAADQIKGLFNERVELLVAQGVPQNRAMLRVNAELSSTPDLYADAWKVALLSDAALFRKLVLGEVDSSVKSNKITRDRPPVPPGIGAQGGGGAQTSESQSQTTGARIVPSAEEKRIAGIMGVDPVKLAAKSRRRGE